MEHGDEVLPIRRDSIIHSGYGCLTERSLLVDSEVVVDGPTQQIVPEKDTQGSVER
jgi:hypothetical protein